MHCKEVNNSIVTRNYPLRIDDCLCWYFWLVGKKLFEGLYRTTSAMILMHSSRDWKKSMLEWFASSKNYHTHCRTQYHAADQSAIAYRKWSRPVRSAVVFPGQSSVLDQGDRNDVVIGVEWAFWANKRASWARRARNQTPKKSLDSSKNIAELTEPSVKGLN